MSLLCVLRINVSHRINDRNCYGILEDIYKRFGSLIGKNEHTIHLNKFEFVEAEIATHKRNWRDGLAFPADMSLRINRLDIGIKRFAPCSQNLFL